MTAAAQESTAIGRLEDGTPYFAPLGQLPWDPDEDRVQCHLCGEWFRFLGSSHLRRTHGWTLAAYREAFQLRGNVPTCSTRISAGHRSDAWRRIEADEFGARYLPDANAALAREPRRAQAVPRWRSLPHRHPELVPQLHPTRNGTLDPLTLAAGSNRKVWWRCPRGHEYQATVHNRTEGWGCPACARESHARRLRKLAREQARVSPERSLAAKRPDLLAELHPTRNSKLDPYTTAAGSRRKLWWCCPDCGHVWRASVTARALAGTGCRRCFMKRHVEQLHRRHRERPPQIPRERSLAVKHPELLAELHPTRNGELDPYAIAAGSNRKVWWRCPRGHEWQSTPHTRSSGSGCPVCAVARRGRRRSTAVNRGPEDQTSGSFSTDECVQAVAEFIRIFGETPTPAAYRQFAIGTGRVPTLRQIRATCATIGGWPGAVTAASTFAQTKQ